MAIEEAERESYPVIHKVADVGRYRLIAELARGGMGIVFLALVRGPGGFNKLFVVKVLKAHLAEDPKLVFMFLEEARLAAKLNHPNVVQTIEVGTDGGRHFIAMEFLDGQSLHRLVGRGRRTATAVPLHYHLHILIQLLEGLQYAHGLSDFDGTPLGLVHRDVSPQNVLVTYEGQIKILDFGIAKALDSSNDTRTGMLKGKVAYMAPEQAVGEAIDRRADLFAVGVMLWEAVVGQRMWSRALNDMQILHALMNGAIPRPRDAAPAVDERLEHIILKATSFRAGDRYASAAEMQLELEAHLKEMAAPAFGARDIGKFASDVFVEERSQIKAVIDEQLRVVKGANSGEFPNIDLPLLSRHTHPQGTPSGVLLSARAEGPTTVEGSGAAMLVPTRSGANAAAAPPGRRSSLGTVAIMIVVALASATAVAFLMRPRPGASAPAPTPSTAITPPAATAAVAPTAVPGPSAGAPRDVASARPGEAHAEASGAVTPQLPRPTSWSPHGAGPVPVIPAPHPVASAPAPPPAEPAPVAPPQSTSTTHVRQQIDTSNPYGH